jgi:hypothetical protein
LDLGKRGIVGTPIRGYSFEGGESFAVFTRVIKIQGTGVLIRG